MFSKKTLGGLQCLTGAGLTYGVDVKEANRRADDGAKHAVVQSLRRSDQSVKQHQTAYVAKDHRSHCQT